MKLYTYWRSSSTWRVRIALHHKGIAYEPVPVHLVDGGGEQHSDGYRVKNPMRQVPLLEVEVDGEMERIAQSLPIIEYLEERYADPPLLPRGPFERARARQVAEMINAGIQPLQNLGVIARLRDEHGVDPRAWSSHWIAVGFAALEETLRDTAGTFCVGGQVSVADLYLIPQLYNARRFEVDRSPYPTLLRVEEACARLPAFVAAHPDQQPDAPTSAG